MSHFFKDQAHPRDLRAVQSAVLWEWAVSTQVPLPQAAKVFCEQYKRIWPLLQLGDPFSDQADRMFKLDPQSVLTILKKLEERYGKYDTRSTTDTTKNVFQRVDFDKNPLATSSVGPLWCRNTQDPREHAELLLRKYGVPDNMMPSRSPGILMFVFFRDGSLVCDIAFDRMEPDLPPTPADSLLTGLDAMRLAPDSFRVPLRVGAAPFHRGEMPPPTGRAVGGRRADGAASPPRSPSPGPRSPLKAVSPRTLPPLDHGSLNSPLRGTPPLGSPFITKLNALAIAPELAAAAASPASPQSIIQHELRTSARRALA